MHLVLLVVSLSLRSTRRATSVRSTSPTFSLADLFSFPSFRTAHPPSSRPDSLSSVPRTQVSIPFDPISFPYFCFRPQFGRVEADSPLFFRSFQPLKSSSGSCKSLCTREWRVTWGFLDGNGCESVHRLRLPFDPLPFSGLTPLYSDDSLRFIFNAMMTIIIAGFGFFLVRCRSLSPPLSLRPSSLLSFFVLTDP